ncbi:hypothetical protein CALVIDRAFT_603168 [Calocera viscosa TUFC12733]|uniref:DUF6533 domain-containing protein n=1 Tax=Calocera viscosa (strain TUFC12733) TaxID=1330018 RepID=A0A167G4I8_CALVF|nr:hypothetical protein CALVIDRAFT_603168 [Calocera viscosa TUFC12733]
MSLLQGRHTHSLPVTFLAQTRNAYYMQFASMVVNVYDILITLDKEIDLVWNRPWKATTLLYLCNRYFVVIESILNVVSWVDSWLSPAQCLSLNILTSVWAAPVAITVIETILVIRVCVLFCHQRSVVIALSALLFSSTVILIVFSAILSRALGYAPSLDPPLYGCLYTNSVGAEMLQTWIWIPSIVVEVVLVALTIFKTCEHLRGSSGVRSALTIILRDGCLYFIVVLALMITNAVVLGVLTDGYEGALLQPDLSISSVLCSRMLLNLRESIYRMKDAEAHEWDSPTDRPIGSADIQMTATSGERALNASTTWGTD